MVSLGALFSDFRVDLGSQAQITRSVARRGEGSAATGEGQRMRDTSSPAFRRRAVRDKAMAGAPSGQVMVTGVDPVDHTWFDTSDDIPQDTPLIMLVPVQREIHGH